MNNEELEGCLRDLVRQTRLGDQASYRSLLETLAPLVRRQCTFALSRFNRQEMAEDVTQETLLAVHLKLHTYDDALPFLAWLQVVIKHKVIDTLRRCKMNNVSLTDLEWQEPIIEDPALEFSASHDLKTLLAQLKPPAGEIIYALKVEDISLEKLAHDYNTTTNNIKVIVHRGLQKLSALI